MPHYRRLWKKFTTSEDVNDMPDDTTRLAWALLPHALDREGRGLDSAAWLRAQLFPLRDDVAVQQVRDMMDWWAERGMIVRYEVDGKKYIICPTFHAHQGNCDREARSEIPVPPPDLLTTYSRPTLAEVLTNSGTTAAAEAQAQAQAEVQAEAQAQAQAGGADAPSVAEASPVSDAAQPLSSRRLLELYGVGEPSLSKCARFSVDSVAGWIREAKRREREGKIRDSPQGWVCTMILTGQPPPERSRYEGDDWRRFGDTRRYIEGQYAEFIDH